MIPLLWLVMGKVRTTKTGSAIDRLASAPIPSSWGMNPSNNSGPNDWKYFWGLTLVVPAILYPFTMVLTPKKTGTYTPSAPTTPTANSQAQNAETATSVTGISQVFW
jgi:hypothetical protein